MNNSRTNAHVITGVGIFTAVVIVLQLLGAFIRFGPFSISLTLIPIVVGAALYGPWAGAWLGFVFSMVVLISGDAGAFLVVNAIGTILTVILKGTLAGLAAGAVFKALEKNKRVGGRRLRRHCLPRCQYGFVPGGLPSLLHGDDRRLGRRHGL